MPDYEPFMAPCDECGRPVQSDSNEAMRLQTVCELRHCHKCSDSDLMHEDGCRYVYARVADPSMCSCGSARPQMGCPGLVHQQDPQVVHDGLREVIELTSGRLADARAAASAHTQSDPSAEALVEALVEAWAMANTMACRAHMLAGLMTDHDRRVLNAPRTPVPYRLPGGIR